MMIALPLIFLYFYNNPNLREFGTRFLLPFTICLVFISLPFILSKDAWTMLFSSSELKQFANISIFFAGESILLTPLVYLFFLYWLWRIRRFNFEMLLSFIGISFLTVAMLVFNAIGWFVWSLPFLVLYQNKRKPLAAIIGYVYMFLYIANVLMHQTLWFGFSGEIYLLDYLPDSPEFQKLAQEVTFTLMVGAGAIFAVRMWRHSISRNSFFQRLRRPFMIAIAGDSGSGKDTLADSIIGILGSRSAVNLSGDDYHKYDRGKKIWDRVTHLNPSANHLDMFADDVARFARGVAVKKRSYDHKTGILSREATIKPSDFNLISGLHAFALQRLHGAFDLKIFLDMDEELRRWLKVRRDTSQRGKTIEETLLALKLRAKDYQKFVRPQISDADLIFRLEACNSLSELDDVSKLKLKLEVKMARGNNEGDLAKALVGICGCQVVTLDDHLSDKVTMKINGTPHKSSLEVAAEKLLPDIYEFTSVDARWVSGMTGVIQLISLLFIFNSLKIRHGYETN